MAANYSLITTAIPGDTAAILDVQQFLRWPILPSWSAISAANFARPAAALRDNEKSLAVAQPDFIVTPGLRDKLPVSMSHHSGHFFEEYHKENACLAKCDQILNEKKPY